MAEIKEIKAFADRYSLTIPERMPGLMRGELAGRSTGNSIEYQDHKNYFPGDDIRHIDWKAYARTDRLSLKLYRQEISPRVDILMDASMSMAVTGAKSEMSSALAYFFYLLGRKLQAAVKIFTSGPVIERLYVPENLFRLRRIKEIDFMAPLMKSEFVRKPGIKIVISDFLFQHDPEMLTGMLSSGANTVMLVQVLSDFELNPARAGLRMLMDAEDETTLDISLEKESIELYLKRLDALREDLRQSVLLRGGMFASIGGPKELSETMDILLRERIITV